MKKYKLLKPMPGYEVGATLDEKDENCFFYVISSPWHFPEYFQEIKEPSDEDVLVEWLTKLERETMPSQFRRILAIALIAKGFDVSKLNQCEHEWENGLNINKSICHKCGAIK